MKNNWKLIDWDTFNYESHVNKKLIGLIESPFEGPFVVELMLVKIDPQKNFGAEFSWMYKNIESVGNYEKLENEYEIMVIKEIL